MDGNVKNVGIKKYNSLYNLEVNKIIEDEINVIIVKSKKDYKDFYKVPFNIYKNNRYWVAPLWIEYKNFFKNTNLLWKHAEKCLFLIYKNNKPIGRIAAILDHSYCKYINKKVGFFGFFECINDFSIARRLFIEAEKWLQNKNIEIIQGPINGRVDIGCGFLKEGFDSSPTIMSSYNLDYYNKFAEKYGMKKNRDFLEFYLDLKKPIPNTLQKIGLEQKKKGIKIRKFNKIKAGRDIKIWMKLLKDCFSNHWGYVPVSDKEIRQRFGVKQARLIIDKDLFLFAKKDGETIAFTWSIPDYNQIIKKMKGKIKINEILKLLLSKKEITQGKYMLIGCLKKYRDSNIASLLNYHLIKEGKRKKYRGAIIGPVDENNPASIKIIEKTGATPYKKYRIYEKQIIKEKKEGLLNK